MLRESFPQRIDFERTRIAVAMVYPQLVDGLIKGALAAHEDKR